MCCINMNKYTRNHKNDTRIHIKVYVKVIVRIYVKVIVRIYVKKYAGERISNQSQKN